MSFIIGNSIRFMPYLCALNSKCLTYDLSDHYPILGKFVIYFTKLTVVIYFTKLTIVIYFTKLIN